MPPSTTVLTTRLRLLLTFLGLGLLAACSVGREQTKTEASPHRPDDPQLYATIVKLDSAFFAAYNTCDVNLDKYGAFYSDSIEFYHDQGGLMTSKSEIIEATKQNVCGKVTRELVKGSIEVYPIRNYGAVEVGLHKFHNNTEPPGAPSHTGRFVITWRLRNNNWTITRVISLH